MQPTAALGPFLRDNQCRFDSLAKSDLVGEQDAFGQRRGKRKQCCVNLVGIHIDARCRKRLGERVLPNPFQGYLMGKKSALLGRVRVHEF